MSKHPGHTSDIVLTVSELPHGGYTLHIPRKVGGCACGAGELIVSGAGGTVAAGASKYLRSLLTKKREKEGGS